MEYRPFELVSSYKPTGDQPEAIAKAIDGIAKGKHIQVIKGATGTGKTFTVANIIQKVNKPTLVLVHNKTLASQLYGEFKELFPYNRVEYFVSNFDFYQPEAYLPKTDTYIEKNAVMNDEIEMLRTSAVNSILNRSDTIVVASVASIYALGDPEEYRSLAFELRVGEEIDRKDLYARLIQSQYVRSPSSLGPGQFRVHGDTMDIYPMQGSDSYLRLSFFGDELESIHSVNALTGEISTSFKTHPIYPAYDHLSTYNRIKEATVTIKEELEERLKYFHSQGQLLEEERLKNRTLQDIDSLLEFGRCPGVENYSRHIDKRKPGERPFNLIDYFPEDFLLVIDESHVTIPQVRGMYNGDRSRKEVLVEYGFRLPSALDNRPLNFEEFEALMPKNVICTSATPGDYELEKCSNEPIEQIIRPTGLLDPEIKVITTTGQISVIKDLLDGRIKAGERAMILTLTIKMAEDLTAYLRGEGYKVVYLHNETKTLERTQVIYQLRKGTYDILVGINLLREGLDIPEVSLICILDADKEGFLRSERSLIQVIGRAARNVHGQVYMFADSVTESMQKAITETDRRRKIQKAYNDENGVIPTSIVKELRPPLGNTQDDEKEALKPSKAMSQKEFDRIINDLTKQMKEAAKVYDFERAAELRDIILEAKAERNQ